MNTGTLGTLMVLIFVFGLFCGVLVSYWPVYYRGWKRGFEDYKKAIGEVWNKGPVQEAIKEELQLEREE